MDRKHDLALFHASARPLGTQLLADWITWKHPRAGELAAAWETLREILGDEAAARLAPPLRAEVDLDAARRRVLTMTPADLEPRLPRAA
jgi:hypothetical protein